MSHGSDEICILKGEEFGANSARRGTGYHDFQARDINGNLVSHTWTSAPVTYSAECHAYQHGLDTGRYAEVVVTRRLESGPFDKKGEGGNTFTMAARRRPDSWPRGAYKGK
jgi:hypothetical protein